MFFLKIRICRFLSKEQWNSIYEMKGAKFMILFADLLRVRPDDNYHTLYPIVHPVIYEFLCFKQIHISRKKWLTWMWLVILLVINLCHNSCNALESLWAAQAHYKCTSIFVLHPSASSLFEAAFRCSTDGACIFSPPLIYDLQHTTIVLQPHQ